MPYTDYYSIEEFGLIAGVRACYYGTERDSAAGNYESHHPCTRPPVGGSGLPKGRYRIGLRDVDADLRTAKYIYARKVLEAAYACTRARYPDWLEHEWVLQEPGWRRLAFTSKQRRQAEEYCDRRVREIANSGKITVMEGVQFAPGDRGQRMLSLLNVEEGWPPLSAADRALLEAAEGLDLERMQVAVREGANVNALENGESALARVAMAGYDRQPKPRTPAADSRSGEFYSGTRPRRASWLSSSRYIMSRGLNRPQVSFLWPG